jgi:hypothetical protein
MEDEFEIPEERFNQENNNTKEIYRKRYVEVIC